MLQPILLEVRLRIPRVEHATLLLNDCFIILSQGHVDRHLKVSVFARFLADLLQALRFDVRLGCFPISIAKTLPIWFKGCGCLSLRHRFHGHIGPRVKNALVRSTLDQALFRVELTAVEYRYGNPRLVAKISRHFCNFADNIHACNDLAKDDVLAVEMWAFLQSNKELTSVGVGAFIRHRDAAGLRVSPLEIFIRKHFLALAGVDAAAARAILFLAQVTALDDKSIDDSMEARVEIVQRALVACRCIFGILTGTEATEVLRGLGSDVRK